MENTLGPTNESLLDTTTSKSSYHMDYGAVLAAAVFEIIISLVGTVGNLFTIIAVLRNRNLQYATNYLIVSLSVADILVCTILVPMRASQHIAYQYDSSIPKTFVEVAGFVGRINIIASISTLVCLSVDRYLALSRPLKYATSIRYNLWKVLAVITTIWCLAIFITSIPKFPGVSDTPFLIFFIVFVLTATLVICVTYYQIFHIIAKTVRKMGKPIRYSNNFQPSSQTFQSRVARKASKISCDNVVIENEGNINAATSSNTIDSNVSDKNLDKRSPGKTSSTENKPSSKVAPDSSTRVAPFSREDRKAAKTVGLVIAAFILLVYPRIIMILYHFGNNESASSKVARFWMRVFLYANSAVNPAFYAYRHKGFRKEFRRMGLQCLGLGRAIRERYTTVLKQDNTRSRSTTFDM
ncbi:alpha-1A adrenergic receptor-like [Dendronephthya gigantea]|uniref:alpha-1A adrenergic receptor-like n=1 Tax=Dendronephthya gigantea TaxID=151771 RepID=UPI00106C0785|nr:alpha-1A adrenergic receptor-like [Dendronephthya gigantea]XP_028409658.1 alpha-1A adrenergic receptor-like [Dendronephthya gigantea]XP_028409659.1 alpha-1A adrenergic receptor-like [Dendronephthya gigantea]XP_028409660.1 alpha-1A adrenergic receptor-like [Dendronephthya gigantea]